MARQKPLEGTAETIQGEHLWEIIPSPLGGRPRSFKSPQEMWDRACEYFKWVDEHPWQKKSANQSTGRSNAMSQNVQLLTRAYTLNGMCAYLGIGKWADVKKSYVELAGFSDVINAIEHIVASQQIDGALVHVFDSNLVARLNGIADTTKTMVSGANGEPLVLPSLSTDDLAELAKINGLR